MVVKRSFSNALNKTMVIIDIIFFVDGLSAIKTCCPSTSQNSLIFNRLGN